MAEKKETVSASDPNIHSTDLDSSSRHPLLSSLLKAPLPHKHFINGGWVAPSGKNTSYYSVINPADEQEITRIPCADASEVDSAVKSARDCFDSGRWSGLYAKERGVYLRKLAQAVADNKERLAQIEMLNSGKPLAETRWDMDDVSTCFNYFADLAETMEKELGIDGEKVDLPDADYSAKVFREPVGVVAAIVPWNYPLLMCSWKLAPALAAGCTVVLKPSEFTPLTCLELCELARVAAGFPAGVLNVVVGSGPITGAPLTAHGGVDKLTFTGSTATGSRLMAAAAANTTPVSLELGGKSSAIIFDDIDDAALDAVVEWILFGCFWTNGQICSATSRVLVADTIAPRFLARLRECVRALTVRNPNLKENHDLKGFLGPLVNRRQFEKVTGMIAQAVQQGATILAQGQVQADQPSQEQGKQQQQPKGFYVAPTVLEVKDTSLEVWREEIFGPVISVMTFKSDDEKGAVALANDTHYGLAGAVFSKDLARARRVVRALRVGVTWINCSQPCFCHLPWGGLKRSGIGRDLGKEGFLSFLSPKQCVTYENPAKPLGWYALPTASAPASASASASAAGSAAAAAAAAAAGATNAK